MPVGHSHVITDNTDRIEMEAIEYATSVADLEAFILHYMKHSPLARRSIRISAVCLGVIIIGVLILLPIGSSTEVLVLTIVGAVGIPLIFAKFYPHVAAVWARSIYSTGNHKTILGWHRLTLLDHELREESEASSHTIRYDAIDSVAETESHVFIYLTAASGHVIPKNAVSSGSLGSFVTSLRERIERAEGSSVPGFAA
jgi:hypothetical protein